MVKYSFLSEVPEKLKDTLLRYISNPEGDTFVIDNLPPELKGALNARYSRAPVGLKLTLINEFLDEEGNPSQRKGSELVDRVLNAFGDDSVGELEGMHVGFEDASNLLTKVIEDRRIGGSPIEQSTRYVKYDTKDEQGRWRYLRPKEIIEAGLLETYERVMDSAFEAYAQAIIKLSDYFEERLPRSAFAIEVMRDGKKVQMGENGLSKEEKKEFRNAYNFTIRCAALDVGRCVLPLSTLTHFGVFGNGRYFTNLITVLKSHDLEEMRERGFRLETELKKNIPTFIKRNKVNLYAQDINRRMYDSVDKLTGGLVPDDKPVTLISDAKYFDLVLGSAMFPYANVSLPQILEVVEKLKPDQRREIIEAYKGNRQNRRDRSGRGLEAGYPLTFDLVMTYAEYRDLQRHRMLTQQRQRATTNLGFVLPFEIKEVGLENKVSETVERMEELNQEIRKNQLDEAAQYTTLFNHRVRVLFGMNLREFQHLAELRTQLAGHYGYRSLVMEMTRQIVAKYPESEAFLQFVNFSDPENKIARAKEQGVIAGKNLAKGITGELD